MITDVAEDDPLTDQQNRMLAMLERLKPPTGNRAFRILDSAYPGWHYYPDVTFVAFAYACKYGLPYA